MGTNAVLTNSSSSSKWFPIGLGIGIILLFFLFYGGFQVLLIGHNALNTSKEVPWGIFIVNYAWAISSIGLSYIASFGIVLGYKQFDVIGRRALYLALIIVIAGAMSVAADLAQPFRFYHLLLTGHYSAPMGVVGTSLTLYVLLIAIELFLVIKRGHHDILVKVVAVAAFLAAIIVHSYHGAIFGLNYSRSLWFGPYYPIYFLLSALFTSSALIIFITVATYKFTGMEMSERLKSSLRTIGVMLSYLLVIAIFFLYWKIIPGIFANKKEAIMLVSGDFALNFWIGEILITYLLPLALLFYAKFRDLNKMAIAGLMVAIGLYIGRYDFIIVGQLVPFLSFAPFDAPIGSPITSIAAYSPSLTEITYTIGLFGFIWTSYILGIKYLPLHEDEGDQNH
ncbi:MAG: polysulfide reductase NrfD [Thermodesulfovibrionales bacterium]|nr:polysulfide reductase NrfD [Thermodesulfovibrionales bacterium]